MNDLLRFDGAVRRDPKIEAWFSDLASHRLMTRNWFEQMRGCGADVRELCSSIHLAPVADCHHQHHEPVVLEGGDNAVAAGAVAP